METTDIDIIQMSEHYKRKWTDAEDAALLESSVSNVIKRSIQKSGRSCRESKLSKIEDDTIGDLKKLIAAQTGTRSDKIVLKKWYTIYKDSITLGDYEIHDGMNLELYYQ